jgi:hypothetical protein
VWFQNARAKEKKKRANRFSDDDCVSNSNEDSYQQKAFSDYCKLCHIKYHDQLTIQEHVFSESHITKVRFLIESSSLTKNEIFSIEPNEFDNDTIMEREPQHSSAPPGTNLDSVESSGSDHLNTYNKFLFKNHMFNQLMAIGKNCNDDMKSSANFTMQPHKQIEAKRTGTDGDGKKKTNNNSLFIENNIMLHINADDISHSNKNTDVSNTSNNADKDASNNKELMHQLYNFSQMSGELIK